jgi:hypothetical protein
VGVEDGLRASRLEERLTSINVSPARRSPRGSFISSFVVRLFALTNPVARNISPCVYHLHAWQITYPYRSVIDDKF